MLTCVIQQLVCISLTVIVVGCTFRVCSHCSIFTLGTYDKTPTYGRLASKVHTYIHKSYLYSAYKFKRVTMRFGRQTSKFSLFRDCLKVSNDSPGHRSLGGRSFHRRGPATEKLLSPSLLCVRGTSRFRNSLESDVAGDGRHPTAGSSHQLGMQGSLQQVTGGRVLRP